MSLPPSNKRAPSRQQQQPLGPDSARAQLRSALMAHIHEQPSPSKGGYARWTDKILTKAGTTTNACPKLLAGDAIVLMEHLKVFKQYTKLLSQACHPQSPATDGEPLPAHAQPLSSHPTTYPESLEWFQHLAHKPFRGLNEASSSRIEQLLKLHLAVSSTCKASTPQQQAYELALSLPHYDRDLTAFYMLSTPPEYEYELEVAHSIMRLQAPPSPPSNLSASWRRHGLLHVLHVAALNMPDPAADWKLSSSPRHSPQAFHDLLTQLNHSSGTPKARIEAIERFVTSYDSACPSCQDIATTLDRLAVLMGVKSNAITPEKHDLPSALASFPDLDDIQHKPATTWGRLASALEETMPPSLLQIDPSCAKKRARQAAGTWSLPPHEFELLPLGTTSLPRLRIKPARLQYQAYSSAVIPGLSPPSTPQAQRLQDIIARVGEISLSPEMAHAALFPKHAAQYTLQQGPKFLPTASFPPDTILAAMEVGQPSAQLALADRFFDDFLAACLPKPTHVALRQPLHLLAWRLDTPGRACIFSGGTANLPQDLTDLAPHTLPKTLLEERSRRPTPSAIHLALLADTPPNPSAIRGSLLHHAQTALKPHHEKTKSQPSLLDTTLDEAFACLIHPPTRNHTHIEIHQPSPPYSETQSAENGLRYRDWLCTFASDHSLEKCKLDSHALDITGYHQALVPWRRETPQRATEWVLVRSSLPLEQRVLNDRNANPQPELSHTISRFTAFVRSAKARLLQDTKNSLPTPAACEVQRHNITFYEDEPAQQILVVYAPDASKRLEFVSMSLLPQTV